MPSPSPFTLLLLGVACCFLGWLGGKGVARFVLRRLDEIEDDIGSLTKRISRREGQAGQAKLHNGEAEFMHSLAEQQRMWREMNQPTAPKPLTRAALAKKVFGQDEEETE
jgi:hypothetical protein